MRKITLQLIILLLLLGLINSAFAKNRFSGHPNIIVQIRGMTCRLCSKAIEKSLLQVNGIKEVQASHKTGTAEIVADESVTNETITKAVNRAGAYTVTEIQRNDAK